ncbi:MAG TPA: DNA replication and repair protein RecF [Gemmatimonadales bacterium]|nr:DNA replication and repair protein RecF [Gemmatimonadales bacterium]
MRIRRLVARGFRNLDDLDAELPASGVVLLGANAQGKTNLLEAIYYPVLFRSFRGAPDHEVARFDGPGFQVDASLDAEPLRTVGATYAMPGRRKRLLVNGAEPERVADAVGGWLAVSFLPDDVGLATGPAAARRGYLDRLLSLADRRYLRALARYRGALAQRNSALRQGRPELARAFDAPLAGAGAEVARTRQAWAAGAAEQFAVEFDCLGEGGAGRLWYRSNADLADPIAWDAALSQALPRDQARGMTTVGPHRDDLVLEIAGRPLREFGSNGQQRGAAVALKLIELAALREARGSEPALLLDDVFAAFDRERQRRLAARLFGAPERQVFLTAPRTDELPPDLGLPVWTMNAGKVTT